MQSPYELNKILIKHNPLLTVISSGKYKEDIIPVSANAYKNIVDIAEKISKISSEPEKDLESFLKGMVLSAPYRKSEMIKLVDKETNNAFSDTTSVINTYLEEEFKEHDKDLFLKLKNFNLDIKEGGYSTIKSFDPQLIKQYVDKTNACINDNPLNFFSQIVGDVGTMYLLTKNNNQNINEISKKDADVAYARLYLFQNPNKDYKFFGVDNVWFSKGNREILNHVLEQITLISEYFELPVFDTAITKEYLNKHSHNINVVEDSRKFYKVGKIPTIERYFPMRTSFENGVWQIKK